MSCQFAALRHVSYPEKGDRLTATDCGTLSGYGGAGGLLHFL
ncbi:hypothetical protein Z949_546 [Sulfitobacter guttiformis KCTC 32187]|nr:hypothetical protein Z949_546 [Sulfitobacter guttiformis KCTC 32187]